MAGHHVKNLAGIRAFAGFPTGIHSRVLVTLLFTDLVDSTALAAPLGDSRWSELLSKQFESARREQERFRGETARMLAGAGLGFADGGVHELKELDGGWRPSRFVAASS